MPAIHPVAKEKAPAELKDVYDKLSQVHGRIPNFFGVLALRDAAPARQKSWESGHGPGSACRIRPSTRRELFLSQQDELPAWISFSLLFYRKTRLPQRIVRIP